MEDFSELIIKDYTYWQIQVHQNQGYLGRCIVWCKNDSSLDLTDATIEEQKELFLILRDLKKALSKVFQPDWFNYAFLGNGIRHLHCHVIPRYASPRKFEDVIFTDTNWGHNYKTDHSFITPSGVIEGVKVKIKEALK